VFFSFVGRSAFECKLYKVPSGCYLALTNCWETFLLSADSGFLKILGLTVFWAEVAGFDMAAF
jgi:hypothetical protein